MFLSPLYTFVLSALFIIFAVEEEEEEEEDFPPVLSELFLASCQSRPEDLSGVLVGKR
jgi:hypothetical protein